MEGSVMDELVRFVIALKDGESNRRSIIGQRNTARQLCAGDVERCPLDTGRLGDAV